MSLQQHPARLIGDMSSGYRHYCGGQCNVTGIPEDPRFVHVLTLDLSDPALSFIPMIATQRLPLLMDQKLGWIAYSIQDTGELQLHTPFEGASESELVDNAVQPVAVAPMTYEQYRASALAEAAFDGYLSVDDQQCLATLGETYSQIGGSHRLGGHFSPYCANPKCIGYPSDPSLIGVTGTVTSMFASIERQLAHGVVFEWCPDDIAFLYSICTQCLSIVGEVNH